MTEGGNGIFDKLNKISDRAKKLLLPDTDRGQKAARADAIEKFLLFSQGDQEVLATYTAHTLSEFDIGMLGKGAIFRITIEGIGIGTQYVFVCYEGRSEQTKKAYLYTPSTVDTTKQTLKFRRGFDVNRHYPRSLTFPVERAWYELGIGDFVEFEKTGFEPTRIDVMMSGIKESVKSRNQERLKQLHPARIPIPVK